MENHKKEIYLAGGCFWGVEAFFAGIDGVISTEVGYANGTTDNPIYESIASTDHVETVKIVYDGQKMGLTRLLDALFLIIDPTSLNQQGNDKGRQYRTGIYVTNKDTLPEIKEYMDKKQSDYGQKIMVEVGLLTQYAPAEDYHQEYLKKNPQGYCHIDLNKRKDI